jgi:hypothetical protein
VLARNDVQGSSRSGLSCPARPASPPDDETDWRPFALSRRAPRARRAKLVALTGPPPRAAVRGQLCRNAVTAPGAGARPPLPGLRWASKNWSARAAICAASAGWFAARERPRSPS